MADPVQRLRKICLALPEVTERSSHGEAAFFVGGKKSFVSVDDHHHGADRLAFWCAAPPGAQEAAMAEDAERYFRPPYVGHRGWIGMRIDTDPDWAEVAEVVRESYRHVAPRRLLALLDAAEQGVAVEELVALAEQYADTGRRHVLGLAGAPGAGKSTLAAALVAALGDRAVLVGLDGFHLSNSELVRLGRHDRKGAPDTFDAAGYVNLLRRLRSQQDDVVYAAHFDRGIEESIAGAVAIGREVPLVVTEGNYLLTSDFGFGEVRSLLDQCWYLDPGEELRVERLVARHMQFGRDAEQARDRALGSDQRNAELVAATRERADRVVRLRPEDALH